MAEPDPDGDPAEMITAYCAPGLKGYATRLLESNRERFREVIEHPYMSGRTDVILATDPNWPVARAKRRGLVAVPIDIAADLGWD
jgi:hypothetical protein